MDPTLIAAGGAIGSSLLGGLFGGNAQAGANRMNLKIAREQMAFQEGSTARQMEFQERMSNTAYQREVSDLKAAGLNPALAMAKATGGSSSPAGASAPGASARMEPVNRLSGIEKIGTALEFARQVKEIELLENQSYKTREEGSLAASQASRMNGLFKAELTELRNRGAISGLEFDRLNRLLPLVVPGARSEIEARSASAREARGSAGLREMELQFYKPLISSGSTVVKSLMPLLMMMFRR